MLALIFAVAILSAVLTGRAILSSRLSFGSQQGSAALWAIVAVAIALVLGLSFASCLRSALGSPMPTLDPSPVQRVEPETVS